jgi:hypothetical protein
LKGFKLKANGETLSRIDDIQQQLRVLIPVDSKKTLMHIKCRRRKEGKVEAAPRASDSACVGGFLFSSWTRTSSSRRQLGRARHDPLDVLIGAAHDSLTKHSFSPSARCIPLDTVSSRPLRHPSSRARGLPTQKASFPSARHQPYGADDEYFGPADDP